MITRSATTVTNDRKEDASTDEFIKLKYDCPLCGREKLSAAGWKRHQGSNICIKAQALRLKHTSKVLKQSSQYKESSQTQYLGDRLLNLHKHTIILRRLPKAMRHSIAEALISILDSCLKDNDTQSWSRLLTFSYIAFSLPKSAELRKRSLTSTIRTNLANLDDPEDIPINLGQRSPKPNINNLRLAVEKKMLDGDISGAVRILASDDSVATPSEELFEILKSKHPKSNKNNNFPPEPEHELNPIAPVTTTEILAAIKSFPNGSAGGLDAMRPQHLKDLTGGVMGIVGVRLCERLASLVDLMLNGNIPENITPFLYGASLTALKKKEGGVRPIAVGNTLRRLAGKIVSGRVCVSMGNILRPNQLGYAAKGGTEAIVHATRSYMAKSENTQVLLKLDFNNAFNCVYRDKLLHSVFNFLPEYYAFIWQLYRNPSFLAFGDFSLESHRGIQQGDPLGPLLFCLVIKDLVSSIKSPLNSWYLDDGTIAGNYKSIHQDLSSIIYKGAEIGLELNMSKCEAFIFGGENMSRKESFTAVNLFAPGIKFPKADKLTLLGSPLLPEGVPCAIDIKIAAIKLLSSRLTLLHAHHALFILKNCLGVPKILHLLRCAQTWQEKEKLLELDCIIRCSLSSITNTVLDDNAWKQASLPVNKGGIGIRRTEELALPAFLASVHSVTDLISDLFPDFILEDVTKIPMQKWCNLTNTPVPSNKSYQKEWDTPLVNLVCENLFSSASVRERARLQVVSLKESGSWLNALPIPSLGNFLDDDSLRISIALRLGSQVGCSYKCKCGVDTDIFGHHALSCNKSSGRYSRHAGINDIFRRAFISAHVPAILEPPGLFRDDGKRPDGMTLMPWKSGKALVWDVTCIDSLADSHIVASIKSAGSAAAEAEVRKVTKYKNLQGKFIFSPLGFETFGAWGPSSKELVAEIGRRISDRTGERRSTAYLRQRISVEIQRGNAASIFSSIPSNRGLDEIFNLLPDKNPNVTLHHHYQAPSKCHKSDFSINSKVSKFSSLPNVAKSIISSDNSISYTSSISSDMIRPIEQIQEKFVGRIGLKNIGNTCFMNSIIQCMSNTRWFLEYLRKDVFLKDLTSNISTIKGDLIRAFAEVIKQIWSEDLSDQVINTLCFKNQFQKFAPQFVDYEQQDAHEFLQYLLQGLHEDMNRVTEIPKPLSTNTNAKLRSNEKAPKSRSTYQRKENSKLNDIEKAQESWCRYSITDNSKIVDNFVGQLKSTLKCTFCGQCSVSFDPFWDLSLPIPQRSSQLKLSQCLELFMREETLDGDENPTCSKCKEGRRFTKSFSIQKFPKILIIHLKRFSTTKKLRRKLNVTIDYPIEGLEMNNYAAENVSTSLYNLYAISNHSGTTSSGHYTAYCRHPYIGSWYKYNDSQVSEIHPKSIISSEAYVLFYEQEGERNRNEGSLNTSEDESNDSVSVVRAFSENKSGEETKEADDLAQEQFEEKLADMLEGLTQKSSQGRTNCFDALSTAFIKKYWPSFIRERYFTICDNIERSLKKGGAAEKGAAADLATIICVQLGAEDLSEEICKLLKPVLTTTIIDVSVTPSVRAKGCTALGNITFLSGGDIDEVLVLMQQLESVFSQSYLKGDGTVPDITADLAVLHSAALHAWSLLFTLLTPGHIGSMINNSKSIPALEKLSQLLESAHLDVRTATGEAIALIFESGREENEDFEEDFALDISKTLKQLATDSHKYRAKKDRKQQRATFRDILQFIQNNLVPEVQVKFGKEVLMLDTWARRKQYETLCNILGPSINVHLTENDMLRDIFEIVGPPPTNDNIPAYPQHQMERYRKLLANAANLKARTLSRAKNRDKRSDF